MNNRKEIQNPLLISISHKGEIIFEHVFTECPITVGRSSKCDIPLQNFDFLSRQHCSINVTDDGIIEVTDLDSSNGIFFEGKRVKQAVIRNSSQVEIGEILISLQLERSIEDQPTVVEAYDPEDEKTPVRELLNKKATPPKKAAPCPVVDAAKTHQRDIESEFGKKLGNQDEESKPKARIPFSPTPKKANDVIPQMVHFNGEHKPLDKNLTDLKYKEQEPSISNIKNISGKEAPKKKKEKSAVAKNVALGVNAKKETPKKVITPHHQASQLRPQQRVLESYVTWKDQIYDLHQFYAGDNVIIGPGSAANVDIPVMNKNVKLAKFDGMNTQVFIPQNLQFALESNESKSYSFDEAAFSPSVTRKKNYYTLKLGPAELVSVKLTPDVTVHLRYAPAPRQLTTQMRFIKDEEMKTPGAVIAAIEMFILAVIFLTKTKEPETPQKIMQERVARLIIEQKPPPPPPEEKKPEPPKEKVAEKKPEPKPEKKVVEKQPKPKKVVKLQKSKLLAKVNKYPVEVEKPMKVADKPVVKNIQAVGALAALSAVSSNMPPSDQPVAININKNAGGQTALNTGGVIGTLKTNTGKLAAGGLASVKTKGLGYGTGTGYGVQGIKGTAGSRAVAGTVVGAPSLVRLGKEDGLSRAQVMDVVKRYMTQIQQCYERSLIDSPGLAGRVEYEWEISAKGSVQWAKVKKSDISGGDNLNKCVTAIFKDMKFPVATNGQNTIPNIGFPFGRL